MKTPMTQRRVCASALLALLLLVPSGARAANARAEELFREGRAAMDAQRWDVACAKFEESLSLETSVGPLLNLAECREKQGKLARAYELWTRGLASMPADDGRRDLAERKVADLERRVPKLVVSAPPGAKVFIDGVEVTPGSPVRVDPGARTVVVTVDQKSQTLSTQAEEGKVVPVDGTPRGAGPDPVDDAGEGPDYTPAIVAFAIGGAGIIGFGVTGVLYLGESATVDEQCTDDVCRTQEGVDAGDARTTLGIVNAVSLGMGLAGVGLGTILLLSSSNDDGAETSSLRLTPRGTGATLDGRF